MKVVAPVAEADRLTLWEAREYGPTAARRRRAQAVELSSRGDRLNPMAPLLARPRETVSGWVDLGASHGLRGRYDRRRCGRPPVVTPLEAEQVRAEVEQAPRQLRQLQARWPERLGKTARRPPRRRVLKQVGRAREALPAVAQESA